MPALLCSALYFFLLLCSYYILRPVRDAMGIAGGVDNLQWVFTATFVVMLLAVPAFGWAVSRFPRRRLLPVVYGFFLSNLLAFAALLHSGVAEQWVARCFFVWVSVFNLFVISVFWSYLTDLWNREQAKRLFGVIAAGGSAGAILGPLISATLAAKVGSSGLLLIAALFLAATLPCIWQLGRLLGGSNSAAKADHHSPANQQPDSNESDDRERAIGGSIWAGAVSVARSPYLLGICVFILLYTTLSTFLYFQQAHIVEASFSSDADRTAVFAGMDLAVNLLTVLAQLLLTARLIRWLGLPVALAIIPLAMLLGFVMLGMAPVLWVLVIFQVVRRAGNYALARPAREMLFSVVPDEDKYKAKNFIDTVVYRGGDAASGWAFAGLTALGLGLSAMAFVAVPIAACWAAVAWLLGRERERRELSD